MKPKATTMNTTQPIGKKAEIKTALESKNYKRAFSIARGFFFGISDDLKRSIEIAADSLAGRDSFYKSLKIDVEAEKQKAIDGLLNFIG